MFFFCHSLGNSMTNQSLLNVAAHAIILASEYMFRVKEFSFFCWKKKCFSIMEFEKEMPHSDVCAGLSGYCYIMKRLANSNEGINKSSDKGFSR